MLLWCMDLCRKFYLLPLGDGSAKEGAERPDCVYIGSPGFLANFWQMAFSVGGRELGKVRMTA